MKKKMAAVFLAGILTSSFLLTGWETARQITAVILPLHQHLPQVRLGIF